MLLIISITVSRYVRTYQTIILTSFLPNGEKRTMNNGRNKKAMGEERIKSGGVRVFRKYKLFHSF